MVLGGSSHQNLMTWKLTSKLDDLDSVDDVALLSSTKHQTQDKTTRLIEKARRVRLKINIGKTKVMRINARNQERIIIDRHDIEDVD